MGIKNAVRLFPVAGLLTCGLLATPSAQSQILVANQAISGTSSVLKVSGTGTLQGTIRSGLNNAVSVQVAPDGTIYFSDSANGGTIYHYSAAGVNLGNVLTGTLITRMLVESDGNLLTITTGAGTLARYSPTGTLLSTLATGLGNLGGLIKDSAGNIYVARNSAGTVRKFSGAGVSQGDVLTGLSSPAGMAFDGAGNFYVNEFQGQTVRRYTSGFSSLGVFASGMGQVDSLLFDTDGSLFVSSFSNNRIYHLSSGGAQLGSFSTNLSNPRQMALLPSVPEPGAVALLGGGGIAVAGVTFRARRRSRRRAA